MGGIVSSVTGNLEPLECSSNLTLLKHLWSSESWTGYPRKLVEIEFRQDDRACVTWRRVGEFRCAAA